MVHMQHLHHSVCHIVLARRNDLAFARYVVQDTAWRDHDLVTDGQNTLGRSHFPIDTGISHFAPKFCFRCQI